MIHNRLLALRKKKNLSRERLKQLSSVSVRTIQRLENTAQGNLAPHGNTVERLAKALDVEPGVLTGALPMPDSGEAPASVAPRVQIGAELAPKARLAYDLVKRRYGVSATEIINMAPFFSRCSPREPRLAARQARRCDRGVSPSRRTRIRTGVHALWRGHDTRVLRRPCRILIR